ncbi:flippase [Candidatus Woesearchaeota archaeon]|nr:flippase [Candidatus Woesearchaeota archaeon]
MAKPKKNALKSSHKAQKFVFDSVFLFIMTVLATVVGYAVRIVLSRQLSLDDFGLFYAVFTLIVFFNLLRDFGFRLTLSKFIPEFLVTRQERKIKSLIFMVLLVNIVAAVIYAVLFIGFSGILSEHYFNNANSVVLLYIMTAYFVLYSFYDVFNVCFLGFQQNKLYAMRHFFINIIVLLGILLFNFGVNTPAVFYMLAALLGAIVQAVIVLAKDVVRKYKFKWEQVLVKKTFVFGLGMSLGILGITIIQYSDTLIMTFFRSLSEVGVYNVVLPSALLFYIFGDSIGSVLMPLVSEYWAKKNHDFITLMVNYLYKYMYVLLLPPVLLVMAFSREFLSLMFTEDFAAGYLPFQILLAGVLLFSIAVINNQVLNGIGKPGIVAKIVVFAALFNIIFNFLLIPFFGMMGAAITTSLSYLIILLLSYFQVVKHIEFQWPYRFYGKLIVSSVFFLGVVLLFKRIGAHWMINAAAGGVVGLAVYVLLLALMKGVNIDEIRTLKSFLKKRD